MKIISPQMQIYKFVESMYPDRDIEVKGYRNRHGTGGKKPPYTAQLFIDGRIVASAQERDWRKAYKTLQISISKGNIL